MQPVEIIFSDFLLNSVLESLYFYNALNLTIDNTLIENNQQGIVLNTVFFTDVLPQLNEQYPNKEMFIDVRANDKPLLIFAPGSDNVEFTDNLHLDFHVITEPGVSERAFCFTTDVDFRLALSTSNQKVVGSVTKLELSGVGVIQDNINIEFAKE